MKRRSKARRSNRQKTKLGLPDLEHVKSAVLVSLRSPESQRSYRRSIDDFVCWYCSEPRLSFNKTVVTRYRIHLEDKLLAPGTINVRLAAVRRLAYEAADTGLLSPDLAAGIRRVKGAKKLGMRLGNWLTVDEARSLWQLPNMHSANAEGFVCKNRNAVYAGGRAGQHFKCKFVVTASFIVGPKPEKKANKGHRSIAVYLLDDNRQRFMGTVGVPDRYRLPK
jgi:hypothetical protein